MDAIYPFSERVYDVGIMSGDEQDAAIIRIVRRRKELRVRKALIESELQMAGDSLSDISGALRHIGGNFPEHIASIKTQLQKAPEICELDRIKGMVAELGHIYAEFAQLNRSAAEAGID